MTLIQFLQNLLPRSKGAIPRPGFIIEYLLQILFADDNLLKLEYLTDFYEDYGLFRFFDNKVYIFDHKLTQSVINKLEKGAHDYLENSPLKDTILGSTNRSPEVRRAIAAIFRKSVLEEKGGLIIKDVEKFCASISKEAKSGQLINVTDWALRLAMDVVGHMLLQLDLYALEGKQKELLECLMTILHRCYALGEISADSEEFRQANAKFEELTTKILSDALKVEDHEEKRLVVKLHEACGFDLARDNMKLFLMAGSETTAATIPVLLYLLTTYPDIQEELRAEADENMSPLYKDPSLILPKLEAVLKEVLRLYPIAPFISRQTFEKVNIGDITLDANTDIKAFTWGIHRSRKFWLSSKEFVPFRFLNDKERASSNVYIPFGAGSRICIGQHLAWLELKIATAILLNRFRINKVPETPKLRFVTDWAHAVVHPDKDLYFRFEDR